MSVPKSERNLSKMEVWKNAESIETELTFIILRDFGIKPRAREPNFYTEAYKMSEEDIATFNGICEKYKITNAVEEYPEWLLTFHRSRIIHLISELKENIRCANDVFPYYREEYFKRREYQDEAIRCCGKLYDAFTLVKKMFFINPDKYMGVVEKIERERALLSGWRKADNKILAGIRKRENK